MATVKGSSSSNVKSLSKTLSSLSKTASSVAATAKAQGKDTTGITNAINKSNAMVSQTNRQGSKSFSGSNEEKAYNANVITASSAAPIPPIKLPPPIVPTGTPDITSLNAALSNPDTGLKAETTGGFTVSDIAQSEIKSNQDRFTEMINKLNGTEQPSAVDIQKKLDKQTGIDRLKQQEAQYTGQIDAIVKNNQAQSLALEGQGRGQTTQFLGGEQARIQREAAIAALPVQAQLAAVQGKIQVATDYINKWGSLLIQDATNKYNQKVKTIEAVYNFGTAQDKVKFDDLKVQAADKKAKETALAAAKTKAMSQALSQPGGASVISAINLATDEAGVVTALGKYNGDVLANQIKQKQLADLYAPAGPAKRDTQVVDGKLIDMQTGEVVATIGSAVDPTTKRQLTDAVSAQESLLSLAKDYKNLIDTYGFTNTITGDPEVVGKIKSQRALMTAEYKKAAALGTLDNGVLTLMESILGTEPLSTLNVTKNITGRPAKKLSSQIDTFITQTEANKTRDEARLGIVPQNTQQVNFGLVLPEDDLEINQAYGITNSTTVGFDPSQYVNPK